MSCLCHGVFHLRRWAPSQGRDCPFCTPKARNKEHDTIVVNKTHFEWDFDRNLLKLCLCRSMSFGKISSSYVTRLLSFHWPFRNRKVPYISNGMRFLVSQSMPWNRDVFLLTMFISDLWSSCDDGDCPTPKPCHSMSHDFLYMRKRMFQTYQLAGHFGIFSFFSLITW